MNKEQLQQRIEEKASKDLQNQANEHGASLIFCNEFQNDVTYILKSPKTSQIFSFNIKSVIKKLQGKTQGISLEEMIALNHYNTYFLCEKDEQITVKEKKKIKNESDDISIKPTSSNCQNAELFMFAKDSLPSASSSWEKKTLFIQINANKKTYVGNVNKLRQIRCVENKNTSELSLFDFDSQSRQIIRFLTQYAESDCAGFSLNAELLAEFFHCLVGYEGFFCADKQIFINKEKAIVKTTKIEGVDHLIPTLVADGKELFIKEPDLILGRSGVWIGVKGHYWWCDGVLDLAWFRNFLLGGVFSEETIKTHITTRTLISAVKDAVETPECNVKCMVNFDSKEGINIEIKFEYNGKEFGISEDTLAPIGKAYVQRDKKFENSIIDSFKKIGFQKNSENNFLLNDAEAIGALVQNKILNTLSKKWKMICYFSADASDLFYSGIKDLSVFHKSISETSTQLIFRMDIGDGETKFKWKELVKTVSENRRFLIRDNNIFLLSLDLFNFVQKVKEIVKIEDKAEDLLSIARNSVSFWVQNSDTLPSATSKEWEFLSVTITQKRSTIFSEDKSDDILLLPDKFNGTLRLYQIEGVIWMRQMINNNCNFILADEMGLGKTIQTLALLESCYEQIHGLKTSLVVCPTSLVTNWEEEAIKFAPSLSVIIISGSDRKALIEEIPKHKLAITSYATIKRDIEFYSETEFGIVVLDEAQHIKNSGTMNAKVCKQINAKHKIVLTGTPLENSAEDIWAITDFINQGMLGTKESFKTSYAGIETDANLQKELAERIAPYILRRHKKDVEQLPEKSEQVLFCTMTEQQSKIYNAVLEKGRDECGSYLKGKSTRFNVLTYLLRLRQICCHPDLMIDGEINYSGESAKMDLLQEIILQSLDSEHKALLFSQFTALLSIIRKWCDDQKILYEYLDGQTKDRKERVDSFNSNEKIRLFLLSLKAGGVGLNLTSADTVIIYDPWWNPTSEMQATDRTHRIGQNRSVNTVKLVMRNSIEEKMIELQKKKLGLFNGVVENSSSFKRLSDKDLLYLLN